MESYRGHIMNSNEVLIAKRNFQRKLAKTQEQNRRQVHELKKGHDLQIKNIETNNRNYTQTKNMENNKTKEQIIKGYEVRLDEAKAKARKDLEIAQRQKNQELTKQKELFDKERKKLNLEFKIKLADLRRSFDLLNEAKQEENKLFIERTEKKLKEANFKLQKEKDNLVSFYEKKIDDLRESHRSELRAKLRS